MCIFKKKSIKDYSIESECLNEFLWVKKVIESCLTFRQLITSDKLIGLFRKKWYNKLDHEYVLQLERNLNKYWLEISDKISA